MYVRKSSRCRRSPVLASDAVVVVVLIASIKSDIFFHQLVLTSAVGDCRMTFDPVFKSKNTSEVGDSSKSSSANETLVSCKDEGW